METDYLDALANIKFEIDCFSIVLTQEGDIETPIIYKGLYMSNVVNHRRSFWRPVYFLVILIAALIFSAKNFPAWAKHTVFRFFPIWF